MVQLLQILKIILKEQQNFYISLYSNQDSNKLSEKTDIWKNFFQEDDKIPKLNESKKESYEGMISEEECVKAIKSFKNGKSPGTDGLPIEFFKIL